MCRLELRRFERSQLPLVEPWFDDPDTRRWLGGPGWPRQMLDLQDRPLGEFRGAVETGRYRWLAWQGETVVGYVDCGTYDRWAVWEGGDGGRGIVGCIEGPAGAIAYVVDPRRRGRGCCPAMVEALIVAPELRHVALLVGGVEPENTASVRCLLRAGFRPLEPEPDWEGVVYYARSRSRPP